MATVTSTNQPDVVLVGAGTMSATLAVFLKELDPSLKSQLHEVEVADHSGVAVASTDTWAFVGTDPAFHHTAETSVRLV